MSMCYNKEINCRNVFRKTVKLFLLLFISFSYGFANADEHIKPHHLSLFVGGTHALDHDLNGETLGLDYEYRVSELIGLGMVAEYAFHEIEAITLIAVADIYTPFGLMMQIGPGVELTDHADRFLFRVGGLYEFDFGSFTVSPQLHWDIVENHDDSLVFGFAFGKYF